MALKRMEEDIHQQYRRLMCLLDEHGITLELIGRRAYCSPQEVASALHPESFEKRSVIEVLRVRACIEVELEVRGWSGDDLWSAYDKCLQANCYWQMLDARR